jgi:hypothetical protein
MTTINNIKPSSNLKALTIHNLGKLNDADLIKIDPDYQTELRWTLYQKQLFIDSLMRGLDIPKLYFNENIINGIENYYVVDGQQRINAIKEFIDDEFSLLNDADPIQGIEVAGKTYEQLDPLFTSMKIDNRNLDIVFLTNYSKDLIKDLFLRLNSMTALNSAEKRKAIPGNMPKIVKKLSDHNIFKNKKYVAVSPKRDGHQNVVAAIVHQIINEEIIDIRPASIATTYREFSNITIDNCSIKKIKEAFQFLINSFNNKTNPKLKKWALMRLTFLVIQMLEEYDLSNHANDFGKAFIAFERKRIENKELPEIDQDPQLVAFNDAARGDRVSDMTYLHSLLKSYFVEMIPSLNLKDRQRNFTQEQRYAIFLKGKNECQLCKKNIRFESFHADHIYPWSKGGETSIANGQALCSNCNLIKSNKIHENILNQVA